MGGDHRMISRLREFVRRLIALLPERLRRNRKDLP